MLLFVNIMYIVFCVGLLVISLFSSHDSIYIYILTMLGMFKIDILDVGMGNKILPFVCWNLMCFLGFCAGK